MNNQKVPKASRRCYPCWPKPTTRVIDRGGVIAVAHQSASASVQLAAQSAAAAQGLALCPRYHPAWVSEGTLVGPGKDTLGTPVPNSGEAVGGPINRYSTAYSADTPQTSSLVIFSIVLLLGAPKPFSCPSKIDKYLGNLFNCSNLLNFLNLFLRFFF